MWIFHHNYIYIFHHECTTSGYMNLFRLRGCEKINEKYTFILYFFMMFPIINFIFWRNEK